MVWLDIMITLLTLEVMSYFFYGIRIVIMSGMCIAAFAAAEFISLRLMHRKFTADDLSCTSDALIIALMMPACIDMKLPVLACIFAAVAAKNVFGGRRNMIFSPAAAAYLFLFTSWRNDLLSYPQPHVKPELFGKTADLVNSASYTYNTSGTMSATDYEILFGNFSGPVGAVSILLLAVSAVILILRKDISAGAFVGTITGTSVVAYLCPIAATGAASVKFALVTNMVLFAGIYIISDVRTAPTGSYHAFFYGFFVSAAACIVAITTGRENMIVIMSVLFTPLALAFRNFEKRIRLIDITSARAKTNAEQTVSAAAEAETDIREGDAEVEEQ